MSWQVIILVLVAAALHAGWNFASRSSRGNLPVLWVSLLLAGLVFLPVTIIAAWHNPISRTGAVYLAATAVIHAIYFPLLASAYRSGQISLVYPVARGTGVAGTTIVAFAAGIDSFSIAACLAIACVCAGIFLISLQRGASILGHARALLPAVGVGLTIVVYSITDKLAVSGSSGLLPAGRLHPLVYIDALFLGTAICMIPYIRGRVGLADIRRALATQKRYILTIGPSSLATYLLILLAYQLAPVSSVVAMREIAVVFGSILGFVLLKEPPTLWRVAGIALVTGGIIILPLA